MLCPPASACTPPQSRSAPSGSAGKNPRAPPATLSAAAPSPTARTFLAGLSAASRSNRAFALVVKRSLHPSSRFRAPHDFPVLHLGLEFQQKIAVLGIIFRAIYRIPREALDRLQRLP